MNAYAVWLLCGAAFVSVLLACSSEPLRAAEDDKPLRPVAAATRPICISGIYPHLAVFSGNGECGIGAVVPWADRLWFLTYPPHHTTGGPDKLYEVDRNLNLRIRPESVGGTHAGRMIHRESNQLIIGPYFIDAEGRVRAADVKKKLIGRMTAVMRHLTDPANKVYFFDMEGRIYEVDVRSLEVTELYRKPVPGDHGKGGYTGQGRVVISNNGERRVTDPEQVGVLAEWDGRQWRVIERRQFCEVTGPGGVHGSPDDKSPLWATGWDRRSLLLKVLDAGTWHTYRLPKASQCQDAAHGWYTEWPRIRQVQPGRAMMDMHSMFFDVPLGFRPGAAGGLRPIATHLRMVVDYCPWGGRIVFASDDTSIMRNPPAGQSQSNLWFLKPEALSSLGAPAGWGGPWLHDHVQAERPCDPFLIAGFTRRCLHLATESPSAGAAVKRCSDRYEIAALPAALNGLIRVTIARGDFHRPAPAYAFTVNRDVVVYLGVDDRTPVVPERWAKTGMSLRWGAYTDSVYKRTFKAGRVEIPGHDVEHKPDAYALPNICFIGDASGATKGLEVTHLPKDKGAEVARPQAIPAAAGPVTFTIQVDRDGSGKWTTYKTVPMPPEGYTYHIFPADLDACWVRLKASADCTATAVFHCSSPRRPKKRPSGGRQEAKLFQGLADVGDSCARSEGIVRPAGGSNRNLQFLARTIAADGKASGAVLYEVDEHMGFHRAADAGQAAAVIRKAAVKRDFSVDAASVILSQGGRRYRLPKGHAAYDKPFASGWPRGFREVVTERNLLNCHGTFYEVPRSDAAGLAALRPIASHGKQITDFCTWRGLLALSGARAVGEADGHVCRGADGVGLWFGAVDDLWKLGKPTGAGGPWRNTEVKAGSPSDPYLMTGFDRKTVELSHDAAGPVAFTIEVDAIADGTWWAYKAIRAAPGKTARHTFPDGFSARWVRVTANKNCRATAWFLYE